MVEAVFQDLNPESIAFVAGMELVGQDFFRNLAVGVEEDLVEIQVENGFPIAEGGEKGVGLLVDLLERQAGTIGSWKDGKKDDF